MSRGVLSPKQLRETHYLELIWPAPEVIARRKPAAIFEHVHISPRYPQSTDPHV